MDLEMGRFSWIIQMGQIESHEFLKRENFPGCGQGQRDAIWGLGLPISGYEDRGRVPLAKECGGLALQSAQKHSPWFYNQEELNYTINVNFPHNVNFPGKEHGFPTP